MKKILLILTYLSLSSCSGQFLTPEQCGYPGYGYADAFIQDALDSTDLCWLLPHVYPVQNPIYLSTGDQIKGEGVLSYGGNIKMFIVQGNSIRISDVTLTGGGAGTEQYGVYLDNTSITNYYDIQLRNVKFKDLVTAGVYVHRNVPVNYRNGITATNCISLGCGIGFYCDERGEYNYFSNCHASEGSTGFYNVGGNNSWVGGSLCYNDTGLKLAGGENDGHNHITGATINHNNTLIYATGLVNGYGILDCDLHVGDIKIINSKGIRICNSAIYCDSLIISNSSVTVTNNDFSNTLMKYKVEGTGKIF